MKLENTIIHLIGFSGVGKYTIANELLSLMDARIIDNHLINNPVFSVIDQGEGKKLPQDLWELITQIRSIVYETIEKFSPEEYNFILTNKFAKDNDLAQRILASTIKMAENRKATYVPVRLFCSLEENLRRIIVSERAQRLKPVSPEKAIRSHETEKLIDIQHVNLFDLEVTNLSAKQAAEAIYKHALQCHSK